MKMPAVGPEHERLASLIGRWEGEEQVAPSPWGSGGPARGSLELRRAAGGFAVVLDYLEEREGARVLEGHGVFTIDPADGSVLWFWFDSIGFPPLEPMRGRWEGDTLVLRKTTARGEALHRFRIAEERLHWTIESKPSGQDTFTLLMTGAYPRANLSPPAGAAQARSSR